MPTQLLRDTHKPFNDFPPKYLCARYYDVDTKGFSITFSLLSSCQSTTKIAYIFVITGKFRREFKNALEKCKCLRGRVGTGYEERSMYQTATRMHISPSQRSNYHLASANYTAGQVRNYVTFIDTHP